MRIEKEAYAKKCYNLALKYRKDVRAGKITTSLYIKQAVERSYNDQKRKDLFINKDALNRVFHFISFLNINVGGKYDQFILSPYQAWLVFELFSWYWVKTKKRRYRYAIIYTARKSGKTVFAVALQLYGLMYDRQLSPQSLLLANSREQASIALEYCKDIIANSPVLAKRLDVQQYKILFKRKLKTGGIDTGLLKVLASNHNRLDGYNPSICLIDEPHSAPTDDVFKVMKSGALARNNPPALIIQTSTAGFNKDYPFYLAVEMGKNVLNGTLTDDSYFFALYTLDEGDDWNNTDVWIKANPNIGTTIDLETLEIEFNQAKNLPSQLNNFLTKNLNLYVDNEDAFITDKDLIKVCYDTPDEELKGLDCYGGLDLSNTRDLTSFVLLFPLPSGKFAVRSYFWRADNPERLNRVGGIDLTPWIDGGYIEQCQTKTIDYDLIFNRISKLKEIYNITNVAFDPFSSALLVPRLEAELTINTVKFNQTTINFNFPLRYLEKLIYDQDISLSANPVLKWNFRNAVLYTDGNGNIKVLKNKSKDATDGLVSLAMATGAYINANWSPEFVALQTYLEG